jgi:hypothetical protein
VSGYSKVNFQFAGKDYDVRLGDKIDGYDVVGILRVGGNIVIETKREDPIFGRVDIVVPDTVPVMVWIDYGEDPDA